MRPHAKKLLEQALVLSAVERAEFIEELFKSFDVEPDNQVDVLWAKESEARLKKYKSGKATTFSVDEAFELIESE